MKRLALPFCVLVVLATTTTVVAQEGDPAMPEDHAMEAPAPPEDAHLEALAGNYTGTGTIMGMTVNETYVGAWDLGHQFFVINTSSTVTMPDGSEMNIIMRMYHKPAGDGTYTGTYFDNWGTMGEFTGAIEDGNLVAYWEDPMHGGNHRSVTTMQDGGGFTVAFGMQQADESWADSGLMTYTPVEP